MVGRGRRLRFRALVLGVSLVFAAMGVSLALAQQPAGSSPVDDQGGGEPGQGVVVFTSDQSASPLVNCAASVSRSGAVTGDFAGSAIDLTGCGSPSGATVTWVEYWVHYDTDFAKSGCPDCYAQLDVELWAESSAQHIIAHSAVQACCGSIEQQPVGDVDLAVECLLSGSTHNFDGLPVNQIWRLWDRNGCWIRSDYARDYWAIRVHYQDPTATPTVTPTNTKVPTDTPQPTSTVTQLPTSTATTRPTDTTTATRVMPTPTPTGRPTVTATSTEVPCAEAIQNGGFETGDFTGWLPLPADAVLQPVVESWDVHEGNWAAQLGQCIASFPSGTFQPAGDSVIWQIVHVPSNVTSAPLTFWYKVVSEDNDVTRDFFVAEYAPLALGATVTTMVGPILGNTGWVKAGPFELGAFAGMDVLLSFKVHQDGNFGCTWAVIDQVELCADSDGPPKPGSPPPGTCWKPGDLVDYAPNGVPDFDMRQQDWRNQAGRWNYDGPVALANSLWWLDARFEQELVLSHSGIDG